MCSLSLSGLWSLFLVCAITLLWEKRQVMPRVHRSILSRGWRRVLKGARYGFDPSQAGENTECRSSAFWMSTSISRPSWAVIGSLHHSALWREKSELKICTQRTYPCLWESLSPLRLCLSKPGAIIFTASVFIQPRSSCDPLDIRSGLALCPSYLLW